MIKYLPFAFMTIAFLAFTYGWDPPTILSITIVIFATFGTAGSFAYNVHNSKKCEEKI